MAERDRPPDDRLREFADEHLDYEVWMLAELTDHFRKIRAAIDAAGDGEPDIPDDVTRNAQVESFAVHVRALLEFFYRDRPHQWHPEDALPGDFFKDPERWKELRPPKTPALANIGERVGTEIAHLTYRRLDVVDKQWLGVIWHDLAEVVRVFAQHAKPELLPAETRTRILSHLPRSPTHRDLLERDKSLIYGATNTTSTTFTRPP